MKKQARWSIVQQAKGESNESHARRAHAMHIWQWKMEKKASGGWLPADEWERQHPGRKARRDD